MKASIKRINLPDAPKPTRAPAGITRSEQARADHWQRVREHKQEINDGPPAKLSQSPAGRKSVWTESNNQKLIDLWNMGLSIDKMAKKLDLPRDKVTARLSYLHSLGVTKPRRPKRTYLKTEKVLELKAQGLRHEDIAERAGISVASVNRILRRAKKGNETESD